MTTYKIIRNKKNKNNLSSNHICEECGNPDILCNKCGYYHHENSECPKEKGENNGKY